MWGGLSEGRGGPSRGIQQSGHQYPLMCLLSHKTEVSGKHAGPLSQGGSGPIFQLGDGQTNRIVVHQSRRRAPPLCLVSITPCIRNKDRMPVLDEFGRRLFSTDLWITPVDYTVWQSAEARDLGLNTCRKRKHDPENKEQLALFHLAVFRGCSSVCRKHSTRWSFTMPTACMKA